MTKAALEARSLGRRYRTTWGLRDCTFSVPEGTVTGLVGPNGAGKSTLLRLAAGLSRPTAGTVSVFGAPVDPIGTGHLDRVGYLDQFHPQYRYLTVGEMLSVGRRLNSRWDDASARRWLDELGIPMDKRVGRLSGGQQAQVALTLCMAKRPDLLLLDEPVASLDPLARKRLLQVLMGTVADRGTTVFLSSHIISELEPVCDHLIVLSSSKVQATGSIDDLLADHRLLVGPESDVLPPGVEVIATTRTSRQTTLLVRGAPPSLGPAWQSIQPDLEEVVIAYLSNPDARAGEPVPPGGDDSLEGAE
ncbi:MAG: ABC transporter ATP-binding protein [Acidimicrobiales bacterium]